MVCSSPSRVDSHDRSSNLSGLSAPGVPLASQRELWNSLNLLVRCDRESNEESGIPLKNPTQESEPDEPAVQRGLRHPRCHERGLWILELLFDGIELGGEALSKRFSSVIRRSGVDRLCKEVDDVSHRLTTKVEELVELILTHLVIATAVVRRTDFRLQQMYQPTFVVDVGTSRVGPCLARCLTSRWGELSPP